jgi:hypothetical protein
MIARFSGRCLYADKSGCSGIDAGDQIVHDRQQRRSWHTACGPTGVDRKADREYMQGMHEAAESRENKALLGEEAAWEYERRMDELAGDY